MALSEAVKSLLLREFRNEIIEVLSGLKNGDYEVDGIDEDTLRAFGTTKYTDGSDELTLYNTLLDEALQEIRSFIPKMLELVSESCQDIIALTKERNPGLATCSFFDADYTELATIKGWVKSARDKGITKATMADILRRGEAEPDDKSDPVNKKPVTDEPNEDPEEDENPPEDDEVDLIDAMLEALDADDNVFFIRFVDWYKSMGPDHRRTYLEDLKSGNGTWSDIKENRRPLYNILIAYYDRHGLYG